MSRIRENRKTAGLLLAVALVAAGLALIADSQKILQRAEEQSIDARFQVRGAEPAKTKDILLVKIDDVTFNYFRDRGMQAQWPFPRRYHGRVIDELSEAGAKVIGVDIQFTEKSNTADDDAVVTAVWKAKDVVLGTTEVAADGSTAIFGGGGVLREIGATAANMNTLRSSDGSTRNMERTAQGLTTFGVALAQTAQDRQISPERFGGTRNLAPIDYAGPPGTVPSISYSRIYSGAFPKDIVRGKIVIVGATAPILQDLHQTPASGGIPMPGPELIANEAATAMANMPLQEAPTWINIALVVGFALLICLLALRLGTLGTVLAGAGLLLLWLVAVQLAFMGGTELEFASTAAAIVLATAGAAIVGLRGDNKERDRLRELFAADATGVVDEVLGSSSPRALQSTDIIAGYRLESVIGRGGMGVVYRATQLDLDRTVAIKVIANDRAADPEFRARFKLESKLAASIDHPNVMPIFQAGEDNGLLFITMRLVGGTDLEALLARDGALAPARTLRIVQQLASALDAAHANGLVHRDVKPANALLTLDGTDHVYLTDFGVATTIDGEDGLTMAGRWVGTLDYLAPEQIRGDEATPSVDIYALAGLIAHCLTGQIPFARENDAAKLWAHVNALPPAPSQLRPDLPEAIDAVVARGMAKDPAERFKTAGELADACAASLGIASAAASVEEVFEPPAAPSESTTPTVISAQEPKSRSEITPN